MEERFITKVLVDELEELTSQIRGNCSSMLAIEEALTYGTRTSEDYMEGIALFNDNMQVLVERVTQIVDNIQKLDKPIYIEG